MTVTIIENGKPGKFFACNRVDSLDHGYDIHIKSDGERDYAHGLLVDHGFEATINRPEPDVIVVCDVPENCWLRFE